MRQHPDQLPAVNRMVEVVNIHFADVPASFFVVVNDALTVPKRVLPAASRYRRAAPVIHSTPKGRLCSHDHQGVDDAVREERNVFNRPPLPAAGVVDLALSRLRRSKGLRLQKIIDAVRAAIHISQHPFYVVPIVLTLCTKHNSGMDVLFVAHPFIQETFSFWHLPRSLFAIGVFPDTLRPY